jgi:hypothetical protein
LLVVWCLIIRLLIVGLLVVRGIGVGRSLVLSIIWYYTCDDRIPSHILELSRCKYVIACSDDLDSLSRIGDIDGYIIPETCEITIPIGILYTGLEE